MNTSRFPIASRAARALSVSLLAFAAHHAVSATLPPALLAQSGAGVRPFYEGKTIQMIVATGTGGTTDIAARLVAKHLSKHIPGNPSIIVQNMPAGAGIGGANYLYGVAKRDGLTIAALVRSSYLDQMAGRTEVNFDFRKFSWIGSFNSAPMMLVCRTDSGYTSLERIRAAAKPPRVGSSGKGSISFIFSSLLEEIFKFKVHHVLGFKSGREIDLGIERGEADCRATSDITIIRSPWPEWMEKRFTTFILQQGPTKSRVLPQGVPTVYELASPEAKPTLHLMEIMLAYTEFDRPYAAPPETPPEILRLLREGFEKMLADPQFAADAKKLVDWDGSYLTGEQMQQKVEKIVTQPPEILKRIREILQ
ncbi:MAG TPA: tripartite tricarboxylate transporter substrate-binding protein [Candidatus Acidoferrales bacterium]|nr:tripartite tricarboxylate transporter substrate-binding protein [Candidatus Acidoferrales bacterium]